MDNLYTIKFQETLLYLLQLHDNLDISLVGIFVSFLRNFKTIDYNSFPNPSTTSYDANLFTMSSLHFTGSGCGLILYVDLTFIQFGAKVGV